MLIVNVLRMSLNHNNSNASDRTDFVKTTPLKMGSISKKLLTPCRRIGLCRNVIKTPTITNTPKQDLTPIMKNINITPETPVTTSQSIVKKTEEVKNKPVRAKKTLKLEKESPKCKTPNKLVLKNEPKSVPNINKTECRVVLEQIVPEDTHVSTENVEDENHLNINNEISINSKCNSNKKKGSIKSFARSLSMQRTSISSEEASDLEEPLVTDITVITDHVTPESISHLELDNENYEIKPIPSKSGKRKLVYSSDEDDFVSSQNSVKDTLSKEDLETKIVEIKQRIEIKKSELEKLKQAAIYKKLHDVDKLNDLTKTWKKGCEDALEYLIEKLQSHGPIDMPTLLKNLQIPKDLIDYNVINNTFK